MTIQIFDHYSDQKHESVTEFLSGWGKEPWNDMNVPIYLSLSEEDGVRSATVVVYHPRKHHIKDVVVVIHNEEELKMFRNTFLGIGERIFEQAAYNLEAFAKGGRRADSESKWDDMPLYYWERKEFINAED